MPDIAGRPSDYFQHCAMLNRYETLHRRNLVRTSRRERARPIWVASVVRRSRVSKHLILGTPVPSLRRIFFLACIPYLRPRQAPDILAFNSLGLFPVARAMDQIWCGSFLPIARPSRLSDTI